MTTKLTALNKAAPEPVIALSACDAGQTIRFDEHPFLFAQSNDLFYIVEKDQKDSKRIALFCPTNGERIIRDGDRLVVRYDAVFSIVINE